LGPYRLEAALDGFKTSVQTGITVQVNSNLVVNTVLGVGAIAEQITVTAAASLVETRRLGVSTVVETERIVALPLNSRDVTQLITLSGLAVQTGGNGPGGPKTGVTISVAGGTTGSVSYSLDGAPHLNTFDGTGLNLPFPDALQEFRITTSTQDASSGVRPGASVNAVTKSGSNVVRGDLFEYMRDKSLNAPDFTTGRDDGLKRNQFGGTFGGPIVKNKLFFFGGYQGRIERSDPPTSISYVPTQAMLNGDFTAIASPACNGGVQRTLTGGFVGNQIDPSRLSQVSLNLLKHVPVSTDPCGKLQYGIPNNNTEHQGLAKVDYTITRNSSFFARYFYAVYDNPATYDGINALTLSRTGQNNQVHSLVLGHNQVLSASTLNSLHVTINRTLKDEMARNPNIVAPLLLLLARLFRLLWTALGLHRDALRLAGGRSVSGLLGG
jgi:hypothetical protein